MPRALHDSRILNRGRWRSSRPHFSCLPSASSLTTSIGEIFRLPVPLIKHDFHLSDSELGILFSAFFFTYTAMQFLIGWLVDRFDANWILAGGFLLWSLATATTGIVRGFAFLLAIRFILGIGESVALPCGSKILAENLPEHYRGFASGCVMSGLKWGNVIGTIGAGFLMADFGWRPVFIAVGS